MIQPVASSAAAAVIVREPRRVRLRLNSTSIRPRIGSAVIDKGSRNEEGETKLVDILAHMWVKHVRDSESKSERKQDAGQGDRDSDVPVAPQVAKIELQPDQEHQQDQPELAQNAEDGPH